MSKQIQSQSKDVYNVSQQNANKFFNEAEKSISDYQQSITDLQRECLQSCRKIFEATIAAQQEYSNKAGISSGVPEAAQKVTNQLIEAAERAQTIQNKVALATIDTATQNIKALNENVKSFVELNRSVAQLCLPPWSSSKQQ